MTEQQVYSLLSYIIERVRLEVLRQMVNVDPAAVRLAENQCMKAQVSVTRELTSVPAGESP